MKNSVIALAGNPNVGKSTVFNALTGLRQHTGNWPGKTVASARGYCEFNGEGYDIVDLPGCYSLCAHSVEEEIARDYVLSGEPDAVIVVCDAVSLERSIILVLQTLEITPNVVVCVNLMDEAKKKGIQIDIAALSLKLGVSVVGTAARSKKGLRELMEAVSAAVSQKSGERRAALYPDTESIVRAAEDICADVVSYSDKNYMDRDIRVDRIISGKITAFPILFLALMGIFWITISGANYPSQLISGFLFWIEEKLLALLSVIHVPAPITNMLILGIYRVLAWVVSVMLPPMAIFFPLFTFLEDVGFLPRVAFNLDKCFKKCSACGKQALSMCMGFGCNAAGVIGCRIIDSPRERLIAIITNNFVPCNGRFPTLIAIISMFFVSGIAAGFGASVLSAALLTAFIVLGVIITFLASSLLSKTLLKGVPSSFTLELPPYRRPQIGKVIVRSVFDRTLFVLRRAVVTAIPAGLVIWIMANTNIGGITILAHSARLLDPIAKFLGMDGVILLAFILGSPANEIVIPIIIMAYMAKGSILELDNLTALRRLFQANGWSIQTALSVMLFSLFHWPCATTVLTIKKETQSLKWTAVSVLLPTAVGVLLCVLINLVRF